MLFKKRGPLIHHYYEALLEDALMLRNLGS